MPGVKTAANALAAVVIGAWALGGYFAACCWPEGLPPPAAGALSRPREGKRSADTFRILAGSGRSTPNPNVQVRRRVEPGNFFYSQCAAIPTPWPAGAGGGLVGLYRGPTPTPQACNRPTSAPSKAGHTWCGAALRIRSLGGEIRIFSLATVRGGRNGDRSGHANIGQLQRVVGSCAWLKWPRVLAMPIQVGCWPSGHSARRHFSHMLSNRPRVWPSKQGVSIGLADRAAHRWSTRLRLGGLGRPSRLAADRVTSLSITAECRRTVYRLLHVPGGLRGWPHASEAAM